MHHVLIPLLPSSPLLQHHKVSDRDVTNMIMVMSPTAAVADEPGGLSRTKTDDKNKAGGARAGATSTISFDRYKTTMQVMMMRLPPPPHPSHKPLPFAFEVRTPGHPVGAHAPLPTLRICRAR